MRAPGREPGSPGHLSNRVRRPPGHGGTGSKPIDTAFEVGRALVSPLTSRLDDGRYSAAVSIRTGRGQATHDRVLRFVPAFDTPQAAIRYATEQACGRLGVRVPAFTPSPEPKPQE